jgi:hypothetical protein
MNTLEMADRDREESHHRFDMTGTQATRISVHPSQPASVDDVRIPPRMCRFLSPCLFGTFPEWGMHNMTRNAKNSTAPNWLMGLPWPS